MYTIIHGYLCSLCRPVLPNEVKTVLNPILIGIDLRVKQVLFSWSQREVERATMLLA